MSIQARGSRTASGNLTTRIRVPGPSSGKPSPLIYLPSPSVAASTKACWGRRSDGETEEALRVAAVEPKSGSQSAFLAKSCPMRLELAGEKDSVALFCLNCACSWQWMAGACAAPPSRSSARASRGELPAVLEARRDRPGRRARELRRSRPLRESAQTDPERVGGSIALPLVPAFKIQPEAFVRLARAATIHQPEANPGGSVRDILVRSDHPFRTSRRRDGFDLPPSHALLCRGV